MRYLNGPPAAQQNSGGHYVLDSADRIRIHDAEQITPARFLNSKVNEIPPVEITEIPPVEIYPHIQVGWLKTRNANEIADLISRSGGNQSSFPGRVVENEEYQ